MYSLLKFLIIVLISLSIFQISEAEQVLKYANIDQLIKETNIGNKMIVKINKLDQENINKLNTFEEELKNIENEIKLKKNIISEKELEKEVNDLKKKIADFN